MNALLRALAELAGMILRYCGDPAWRAERRRERAADLGAEWERAGAKGDRAKQSRLMRKILNIRPVVAVLASGLAMCGSGGCVAPSRSLPRELVPAAAVEAAQPSGRVEWIEAGRPAPYPGFLLDSEAADRVFGRLATCEGK